jgi:putative nucleotidyltransferase with HDIG domain
MKPLTRDRRLDAILDRVGQLPTLPPVAMKILALIEDSHSAVQGLSEIISKDPALTARVLRLVNSSYYGLPYRVSTVSHSVALLGFDTVRSLALGLSIFGLFEGKGRGRVLDRNALWTHSLTTAVAAKRLAQRVKYSLPEEAFVAGLLHDMGRFILDEYFPGEMERVSKETQLPICEGERQVLGFDHAQLGGLLAQRWGLPPTLAQSILGHHQPLQVSSSQELLDPTLTAVVALAGRLSGDLGENDEGEVDPSLLLTLLGIPPSEIQALEDQLRSETDRTRLFLGVDEPVPSRGGRPVPSKPEAPPARPVKQTIREQPKLLGRLSLLMEVIQRIGVLSEDESLLPNVVLSSCELSRAAAVLMLIFRGGQWQIGSHVGLDRTARETIETELSGPAGRWFLEAGEVIVADDLQNAEVPALRSVLVRLGVRSLLALPVGPPGRHRGVLMFLERQVRHWDGEDVGFLMAFAQQVGVALENAELYRQVLTQLETIEETQTKLIQAERLAALGQFSSAIANEISGPLTTILGYVQSLRARCRPEDEAALTVTEAEALRCNKLLHDLLDFSQPEPMSFGRVDVPVALESCLGLLQSRLSKATITVQYDWDPHTPSLEGDFFQLQQAFLHLFLNAIEGMENGGQLRVGTSVPSPGAHWMEVWVKDTGRGIPDEDLPRIADPFYKTKEGRRMGLGLAICRRIVESHGGAMRVTSRIGEGSLFTLRLPVKLIPSA